MKPFRSIRWRLQFWHGLLLALVLGGFGLTAWQFQRASTLRSVDEQLGRQAAVLAQSLRPERRGDDGWFPGDDDPDRRPPPPVLHLRPEDRTAFAASSGSGLYYVVWLRNGPAATRSEGAPADVPEPGESDDAGRRGPRLRTRGPWREAWLPLKPGDCVLVGRSIVPEREALGRLAWLLAGAGAGTFALAWLGGGWFVSRALRPIDAIRAASAGIAAGDLTRRIQTPDRESELGRLASDLNATFGRLEAAFNQQSRFTADAAHELRTPVTVILSHVQNGLAEGGLSDGQREALEACQRAAQRMRRLVESLLELARLDGGRNPPRRLPIDLAVRAGEAANLIRPLADERGLKIETRLEPAPGFADPDRIDQVLANLLANAVQHNRPGGSITVVAGPAPDGRGGVAATVSDTGPGIDAEHLPHLFERFYRVDRSRAGSTGGTGLGLAISKAIAEAHGGTLTVESRPGHGSSFTLWLPG